MIIRKATLDDVDAIYELGSGVDEFTVNATETVNFWPKDVLARALRSDDVAMFVAEGEDIYIQPHQRGRGIGDKLLESLIDELQRRGCQYIATLVPPEASSAIDLYQRCGFSQGEKFVWLDRILADVFKQ